METTIAIIGGGPGGYVAAIRAAQLGGKVILIEKERLGGTCLNVGCIPTKALLQSAEALEQVQQAKKFGISAAIEGFDWSTVMKRKDRVVKQLVKGVQGLMKTNQIEVLQGTAKFLDDQTLEVARTDGEKINLQPDQIIIATGSQPFIPPIKGLDSYSDWLDSSKALSLEALPASMLIIGGGVIGIEFASIFNQFGVTVTIVEEQPEILPAMDQELAELLRKKLTKAGINFQLGVRVEEVASHENGVALSLGNEKLTAEKLLIAVGRRSYTQGLGLENTSVKTDKQRILVNERTQTNVAHIYAIGDCTGQVMLAHYASAQGEIAAENALGAKEIFHGEVTPGCVYSDPEFAGVGLTEQMAAEKGMNYRVGKFPLKASGKALAMDKTYGFAKVLVEEKTNKLIGVHLLCERATDLITEAAVVMQQGGTTKEILETIHPHPTLSEVIREAVMAADQRAIHIPN
ncbi:dihydrolipoyl dehydrogenase [Enterococcus pallens]|uniref:Dihydrolipoyl dehydrogenase n=1 Tax=Enterococcus pallens ATCC BAA-351 TaxID=1158607 RepID=R2Q8W7_9ENTE|nr:dihydrolipoyl dehydrogenase [Enterococcus pallens]EOH91713.1 dihydrolipoyl dehydrogenase [Enterococcus pallens ATCC BAA-351]EOU25141.1 dihydrolipoyl dehydrogenase [Enterococcus pallens ATCC BAA-351]OJG78461.1 dihydrolipoyl dehydrogenase [Enterococcus pallens]